MYLGKLHRFLFLETIGNTIFWFTKFRASK
jgi:hypothetical protein